MTVEGAYYHYNVRRPTAASDSFYVLAAYATPELLGVGNIQPMVRYQWAKGR